MPNQPLCATPPPHTHTPAARHLIPPATVYGLVLVVRGHVVIRRTQVVWPNPVVVIVPIHPAFCLHLKFYRSKSPGSPKVRPPPFVRKTEESGHFQGTSCALLCGPGPRAGPSTDYPISGDRKIGMERGHLGGCAQDSLESQCGGGGHCWCPQGGILGQQATDARVAQLRNLDVCRPLLRTCTQLELDALPHAYTRKEEEKHTATRRRRRRRRRMTSCAVNARNLELAQQGEAVLRWLRV